MLHFINKIIPLFFFHSFYVLFSLFLFVSALSILRGEKKNIDFGRNFHLWFIYQFRYNWTNVYGWQHRLGAFKLSVCAWSPVEGFFDWMQLTVCAIKLCWRRVERDAFQDVSWFFKIFFSSSLNDRAYNFFYHVCSARLKHEIINISMIKAEDETRIKNNIIFFFK